MLIMENGTGPAFLENQKNCLLRARANCWKKWSICSSCGIRTACKGLSTFLRDLLVKCFVCSGVLRKNVLRFHLLWHYHFGRASIHFMINAYTKQENWLLLVWKITPVILYEFKFGRDSLSSRMCFVQSLSRVLFLGLFSSVVFYFSK